MSPAELSQMDSLSLSTLDRARQADWHAAVNDGDRRLMSTIEADLRAIQAERNRRRPVEALPRSIRSRSSHRDPIEAARAMISKVVSGSGHVRRRSDGLVRHEKRGFFDPDRHTGRGFVAPTEASLTRTLMPDPGSQEEADELTSLRFGPSTSTPIDEAKAAAKEARFRLTALIIALDLVGQVQSALVDHAARLGRMVADGATISSSGFSSSSALNASLSAFHDEVDAVASDSETIDIDLALFEWLSRLSALRDSKRDRRSSRPVS